MPSRAETRVWFEHSLRGLVIAALAVMLWQSLHDQTDSGGVIVNARGVGELADWSSSPKPHDGIHIRLDSVPKPPGRVWLGALAGAGTHVTWSGDLPAVMIDAQPVASPTGGMRVLVHAPRGSSVVIGDDVGGFATVQVQGVGAAITLASATGHLTVGVNGSVASTVQRDSVALHKVLVIGNAGWESKFVVAALEEEGWKVDAFIRVAPGVDVTQGSVAVIDTSRYSAVVALDGAASAYANRIIEFARTGGGVVLSPRAAILAAMASLRSGAVGRAPSEARPIQASGSVSLATLALAAITSLRGDAIQLERRAGAVTSAARRIGAGRALQIGYEDTWQWRMEGGEGTIRDHRAWWTGSVTSVAYAPWVPGTMTATSTDEAPLIGLVAAIGPDTLTGAMSRLSESPSHWMAWLCVLMTLGLIGEIASRRLRGES